MKVVLGLPVTGCAVLLIINPTGPVHSVVTVTGTSTNGLSSTVQIRVMEDPTIGTTEGVTVTLVGAGTKTLDAIGMELL